MDNLTGPERDEVDRLPLYWFLGCDETPKLPDLQIGHNIHTEYIDD